MGRLSYEDSCRRLLGKYLDGDAVPPMSERMPHPDDDGTAGVRFFRTFVGDGDDLSQLTLPRTFFGRSEISRASFRGTDFTESYLCWNEFTDVDFSAAVLARCDLRAADFTRVKFEDADLSGADLRRSTFSGCSFRGARMEGTTLTRVQGALLTLSGEQRSVINWTGDAGPEPSGG